MSINRVHSAAGSWKLLICDSHMEVSVSAKGVTEKEHMTTVAPCRMGCLQAPLTAGIHFRGERKMESSLQHLSVHRGPVRPILWEVPVIGMNRSVHPVNLGKLVVLT